MTWWNLCRTTGEKHFNSHPHEEDDFRPAGFPTVRTDISTHILTKRMTLWRHGITVLSIYFNSHPHEEDDYTRKNHKEYVQYFNSHPHEEDDFPVLS